MLETVEADYVVVGAGAAGMAFTDTLIRQTNATVAIIDRQHKPGGHWNDAYPFVRLHVPSHYYGVESTPLGSMSIQRGGLSDGLLHMASSTESLAYYEHVMENVLLASGRVTYLPMTEFDGRETARSLVSGQPHRVVARKRIVDATFSDTQIPLTHKRGYSVSEDVACVPINDLAVLSRPWGNYCIIGSGKTGIDACLWLLSRGVDPDRIRWIAPHEAWWFNRAKVQFSEAFFEDTLTFLAEQMEAASEATSAEDLFSRFEALGICFRLDPAVTPAIFRSATVSEAELHQLRRIQDVVRMGRVRSITSDEIELEKGALSATRDCLYIDCSAAGLTLRAGGPIFEPQRITIQYVRAILPCLSAAAIAFIEANFKDDGEKNHLCTPMPLPREFGHWARMMLASLQNQTRWSAHPDLMRWTAECRLDGIAVMINGVKDDDAGRRSMVKRARNATRAGFANMPKLLSTKIV